jgi:hypothetical protein
MGTTHTATVMAHKVAQQQAQKAKTVSINTAPRQSTQLTAGDPHIRFRNSQIISQEVINLLLMDNLQNNTVLFIPTKLTPPPTPTVNFKHYAMPMVHPNRGETISSYKQLMNNPFTADTCQMAFGKDFGNMCQGGNTQEQKAQTLCL